MVDYIILILFACYIAYLMLEYKGNSKRRAKIKYVVHVNGTRGKSTVSRLIDAGLRNDGYRVVTKTTGTSPRLIDVDGNEVEIVRKNKANIKEQIDIIKEAAKQQADVLVIECMALDPYNQYVTQKSILKADIGVVTNVRHDHLEEMGPELNDVAYSLGFIMPTQGIFVTGEKKFADMYRELAIKKDTRFVFVEDTDKECDFDFKDNISLALEVCKELGVDETVAYEGMKNYKKDPGVLKITKVRTCNDSEVLFVNAFAANDPDSTLIVYEDLLKRGIFNNRNLMILFNNRKDRHNRMVQQIEVIKKINPKKVCIVGETTNIMKQLLIKKGYAGEIDALMDGNKIDIMDLKDDVAIFAMGNIGGVGMEIVNQLNL